ncbi:hypothetical protein LNO81_10975 [Klebsiella variicola subsp. variicola]|nr:hypothetical protein [Klebsiella variicola subsp. variicola]
MQQVIARDNLLAAVKQQGAYLQQALREVLGELPHVGDTARDAACLPARRAGAR